MNAAATGLRSLAWWLLGAALLPLLIAQGRRARRDTPRLPPAQGACSGVAGAGAASLSLVAVGESPVAGVGVVNYEESIAACLAAALAQRTGRAVRWQALGENGARAHEVAARLLPQVVPLRPDLVIVVLGVNDTTGFTTLAAWRAVIRKIIAVLRTAVTGPIVFVGLPPMGSFTALPQPLRYWLGLRARLLDEALGAVIASAPGVHHVGSGLALEATHLARDGYHPSAAGCAAWAGKLADAIAGLIR